MNMAEKKILNNYLSLLERLSPKMKLNLSEQLKKSAKTQNTSKSNLRIAFGAWKSNESAEELIQVIRSSRNTNRQIEKL